MNLSDTVSALMHEGKGILFTTESSEAENERFASYGISDEGARKSYRELLFTTPGIEEHLSGVILSPEAVHEAGTDGTAFTESLASKNILSGVIFDSEIQQDQKFSETIRDYKSHGITFAVSVAAVSVSDEPVSEELQSRIRSLAQFAKSSIAEGIAPLLAVDVSMYGVHASVHAEDMILETLSLLSDALKTESVPPEEVIVGVSMAVSGSDNSTRADAAEVAERTVRAGTTALPEKTAGVVFLSDAQNAEDATANLNALARLEPLPWPIAFCFSRALQDPVLQAFKGNQENFAEAQALFIGRLSLLSQADAAGYSKTFEEPA